MGLIVAGKNPKLLPINHCTTIHLNTRVNPMESIILFSCD